MIERIDFDIKVYDNFIEIIPKDGMKDNSVYEIKLKELSDIYGSKNLSTNVKFCTALTPAYATIQAVESLIESCNIPEETILYHIRDASRFVDYIQELGKFDETNIPYEVEQYVKYKAAYECMIRFYVEEASSGGKKGQLGEVIFETQTRRPDISELLKTLKAEYMMWQDALRGYKVEGRAKPLAAMRAKNSNPPMTNLGLDFNRGV